VFTALLAPALVGERISLKQGIGVALGFAGIFLVLAPKIVGIDSARLEAVLVPLGVNLLAMLSVTLGSFYQKRFVSGGDLRTTTVWQ
uniref:hypothetical protein n=1 Tax=Acinetobacter baumannii TaxID=470 RepID=UPI0020914271